MKKYVWPVCPRPEIGESFSSWFVRLSRANGILPKDLYRSVLPGANLNSRDLDRFACDTLIEALAIHTDLNSDRLVKMTIRPWAGIVFDHDDGLGKLPWLPPVGTELSKRSFGQQICTACLADDKTPYYRVDWRLSFVTVCLRHRQLLVDRCPTCAKPFDILKARQDGLFVLCQRCGYDLRKTRAEGGYSMGTQLTLLDLIKERWHTLPAYGPVISLAYFKMLLLVFRLLSSGRFAQPMRHWLIDHAGAPETTSNIPRVKEVELLNPRCRNLLLEMAFALTEDWPSRFVDACNGIGLTSRHLLKDPATTPFAYWHAVTDHLSFPVRAIEPDELSEAKAMLRRKGVAPTYWNLVDLTGNKILAHRTLAEPAVGHKYGAGRYWKLDGVSPHIRAAAKAEAHRHGESIGSWIEGVIARQLAPR